MEDLEKKINDLNRLSARKNFVDKVCKPFVAVGNAFGGVYRATASSFKQLKKSIEEKQAKKLAEKTFEKEFQAKAQEIYEDYLGLYNPELIGKYTVKYSQGYDDVNEVPYQCTEIVCHTEVGPICKRIEDWPPVYHTRVIKYQGFVKDDKGKYVYVWSRALGNPTTFAKWNSRKIDTLIRKNNGKFVENNRSYRYSDNFYCNLENECHAFMMEHQEFKQDKEREKE